MKENVILLEKQGPIATMYLNRPEKRNALNLDMWKLIPIKLREIEADDEIKVLIIRGRDESAFAAGADISEFETMRLQEERAIEYDSYVHEAEQALSHFSKPTIAMIQKFCIGGGCEIALACDLRFSSSNGIFGITPAKLGLIYSVAATKKLVDTVGPSRAKDILYSGRFLDANEAYAIGLIDHIYSDEEIVSRTYDYAKLLSERAQKTIKGAKKIIQSILSNSSADEQEIDALILDSYKSRDYKEGVTAFLEKRKPIFKDV